MNIGILTDSTVDLAEKYINKYDIEVVPLSVHFGDKLYIDGIDINSTSFFKKLKTAEKLPTTSMPPVSLFKEKYKKMAEKYDYIISLHLSSTLSGTLKSARMAAREISDTEIYFIDSLSISLGLGFLTLLAAKLTKTTDSIQKIIETLETARKNIFLYFTVNELKYLQEGGRIGKARALLGSILNINPIISIDSSNGEVIPLEKTRGKKRTMKKMVQMGKEKLTETKNTWIGFVHGERKNDLELFKKSLLNSIQNLDINYKTFSARVSPTLGCHVGPNVYAAVILTGNYLPMDI
ncbi:MAG: DegV family protein [Bacillota bacterium]